YFVIPELHRINNLALADYGFVLCNFFFIPIVTVITVGLYNKVTANFGDIYAFITNRFPALLKA
ncbi:MAG: hypothetical protein M0P37_10045, partial [Synergistaceae bacterium]|nr:hypothetical protein [Synergistaceae bacterium]